MSSLYLFDNFLIYSIIIKGWWTMKISFYTLGCKVNQYETNSMIEQCRRKEWNIVDFGEFADISIINTCTVTNMSDRKSRQIISKAKKMNSNCIIVVTGCLAQTAKKSLEKLENIDLIIGNEEKKNATKYIDEYLNKSKQVKKLSFVEDIKNVKEYSKDEIGTVYEKTRAVMKIQDGCNNFCTYCIIPYARGRIRSKNFDDAINEAKKIVGNGYKEIVLTGIHICSYGVDLNNNLYLIDLLEKMNSIEGLKRIRLSSLEPNIITEEFLSRLVKLDKVCPHFHVSLQSGCNDTLKRMNRKYLTKDIEHIVDIIRKTYPDSNITTDIIVGFPGETDEDFNATKEFLEKIYLNKMHVFQYSKRKGTLAAQMINQVNENVKHERSRILIDISDKNEKKHLEKYIGRKVEILIENSGIIGFTDNYLKVQLDKKYIPNTFVNCEIEGINDNILIGKGE